jgi:hypothetical protein
MGERAVPELIYKTLFIESMMRPPTKESNKESFR